MGKLFVDLDHSMFVCLFNPSHSPLHIFLHRYRSSDPAVSRIRNVRKIAQDCHPGVGGFLC